MPSPLSLLGRHAIITGGSRGIGLGIARLFASEGASVTLVGRNQSTVDAAAAGLPNTAPASHPHRTYAFDVSALNGWSQMLAKMQKNNVDILVNAAGISQNSFLFRTPLSEVRNIIDTNLIGTIAGCQLLSKKMMTQKHGCIINISSLLATHAGRGASVYAASKAGIIGLTRSLAWEVGRFGVRVNVILPGYIETNMTRSMDEKGNLSTLIPLGRLGLVEEVADAALFLAKNQYAHNTVLNLDGGLSAT